MEGNTPFRLWKCNKCGVELDEANSYIPNILSNHEYCDTCHTDLMEPIMLVATTTAFGSTLDDLIHAASLLSNDDLLRFCITAHNLRHAAMAAVGRRNDPEFDIKLDQLWQELYHIPTFCFTEPIIGGKIKQVEVSQELLDALDELEL